MGLLVPVYVMVVIGTGLGAWVAGRQAPTAPARVPWAWLAVLAVGGVALLAKVGPRSLARGAGGICVALSAAVALRATRRRARADLLLAAPPQPVDQAVARVRATGRPVRGVFIGQLEASESLTSPGGVACAFFEAHIREAGDDGRPGRLVSQERGLPHVLTLAGGREVVAAELTPGEWWAPVEVRRVALAEWAPVLTAGAAPVEALSYERVGRLGQRAWLAGELSRGPVEGAYRVQGGWTGKALLGVGTDAVQAGQAAARRAWWSFGVAGLLCGAAAFLLSAS